MSRSVLLLLAGWVLVSSAPLVAQDAVLTQIYGNGVHAYFGQDYLKSHQLFTTAIDGRIQDPRCYYFRGLALIKLGRPQEAEADFQQGAKLESASESARSYNVARALERVQGSDRGTLEQYRIEARMKTVRKMETERRAKYDEDLKAQRDFLQKQAESGTKAVDQPGAAAKPVEVPGEATKPGPNAPPADPFSQGDEGKAGAVKKPDDGAATPAAPLKPDTPKPDAAKPAAPAEMPEPAKPDAAKPAAEAGDNPFGDAGAAKPAVPAAGPSKSSTDKPDAAKPAAGGAAKPAADDPFAEEKPADAKKPADVKKPADAKPAEKKPADEKKPDDNPFG